MANAAETIESDSEKAPPAGAPKADSQPWPSAPVRYYALGALTLTYALAYVDRAVMAMLIEPIKADLHLSDTQISLLTGLAFAIFYALMGLPLGRLVDHASRKLAIAGGVALWSLVTATCGLAQNFTHLFLSRMGVGVGEAVLSPGAMSMLSDLFRPSERSRAGGIYTLGVSLGSALAYVIGGLVVQFVPKHGGVDVPILGMIAPWRFCFLIVGLPGLLFALLMLTVREPARRAKPALAVVEPGAEPSEKLLPYLRRNFAAVFFCVFGYALVNVPFITIQQWAPSFLARSYHLQPGQIGLILGGIFIGPSMLGQLFGGALSDWRFGKGSSSAPIQTALVCAALLAPISGFAPIAPALWITVVLTGATTFLVCASVGHGPAALTLISPNHLRGQLTAVYFLAMQVVVIAMSSTLVAVISDYVLRDPSQIRVGMAIVSGSASVLGVICLSLGLGPFSKAARRQGAAAPAHS